MSSSGGSQTGGPWAEKRATLTTCLLSKGELESSSLMKHKRSKGSLPEKSATDKKDAYSKLRGVVGEGRDEVDVDVSE